MLHLLTPKIQQGFLLRKNHPHSVVKKTNFHLLHTFHSQDFVLLSLGNQQWHSISLSSFYYSQNNHLKYAFLLAHFQRRYHTKKHIHLSTCFSFQSKVNFLFLCPCLLFEFIHTEELFLQLWGGFLWIK